MEVRYLLSAMVLIAYAVGLFLVARSLSSRSDEPRWRLLVAAQWVFVAFGVLMALVGLWAGWRLMEGLFERWVIG